MESRIISQLKILKLSEIKPNFSELSRIYGCDRRTIKKYYDGYEGKPSSRNKPSYLDKYAEIIKTKLAIKGSTVRAVYEYIKTEVDERIGTYSNFNKYVKAKNLVPKSVRKGHPRFETPLGYQAQVDWKEDITLINKHGEVFNFNVFDYKLGSSRYIHFSYSKERTRQDVFRCLIDSFDKTGGVPKEILFDNMSTVVNYNGNRRNISNEMKTFAKDFNFKIRLAKPYHPYTKGKVETINKFLDWLKPYQGEFETEDDLIKILEKINNKVNLTPNQTTMVSPILLYQKEKEYLQPLPNQEIINHYLKHDHYVHVQKDSLIMYRGHRYSVPAEYIGKLVSIIQVNDQLHIYHSTKLICVHTISDKIFNYHEDVYRDLLSPLIKEECIDDVAQDNLQLMDTFLRR